MKVINSSDIEILYSQSEISNKVQQMGMSIQNHYQNLKEPLLVVCVLKGSCIFFADLCRSVDIPMEFDFMGLSSYGNATKSSGIVQITQDLTQSIENRHVLIVEDIFETGLTMQYLVNALKAKAAASIGVCCLLHKPKKNKTEIKPEFTGFEIDDSFVVGYGLDFEGLYRNLPFIGILPSSGKDDD